MAILKVCNRDIGRSLHLITADDVVQLEPGKYHEPVVLTGICGTRKRPIIIESAPCKDNEVACFTSDMSLSSYNIIANRIAAERENAGYYPSVGQTADESMLVLRNCQYVIIRNLNFHKCWPGAIYLDQCQQVLIDNIDFKEGTIAIGANGSDTRNITVQNCHWQQDVSTDHKMWDKIPWGRIHGASDNEANIPVDLKDDYRAWDGDFFRAWDVIGNVTIRNNKICDAFNGIHFFNRVDKLAPGVDAPNLGFNGGRRSTANILIEGNHFTRVRDNCIEPEYYAWNWVVRQNRFLDCYRPFSFEFDRAGWFYVYGNVGSFVNKPSLKVDNKTKGTKDFAYAPRSTMTLFKVGGVQKNEGGIYVFNNSWHYKRGKGLFPKNVLASLEHFNNAMSHEKPKRARTFGRHGDQPTSSSTEESRFTRNWKKHKIRFDGDIINDRNFPNRYLAVGYKLGPSAIRGDPQFVAPVADKVEQLDFSLQTGSPALGRSISWVLKLPSSRKIPLLDGVNVGADQPAGLYEALDAQLDFLPRDAWFEDYSNPVLESKKATKTS